MTQSGSTARVAEVRQTFFLTRLAFGGLVFLVAGVIVVAGAYSSNAGGNEVGMEWFRTWLAVLGLIGFPALGVTLAYDRKSSLVSALKAVLGVFYFFSLIMSLTVYPITVLWFLGALAVTLIGLRGLTAYQRVAEVKAGLADVQTRN